MPTLPKKGKIRIPAIPKEYGIDEATIRAAVANGELAGPRSWVDRVELKSWIDNRANSPRVNGSPDHEMSFPLSQAAMDALGVKDDIHLSKGLMDEVEAYAKISKSKKDVADANERRLLAMKQAARLADTVETVVLIDHVFAEWMAEIRALVNDMAEEVAKVGDVPPSVARKILTVVTNRLLQSGEDIADRLEGAEDEHVASIQDKVRRTGRKVR